MPLSDIKTALINITDELAPAKKLPCSHYTAAEKTDRYIVWAEDGEGDSQHADNRKCTQVLQGTIDYFTKTEYDPNVAKIQEALDDAEISWKLNSVQYEDATGYIHYEWVFELV